ncbi:hypothetical protein QL285_001810 [Trifolium repens]|jgi:hypothetical protein|nr:hypothetical protein QL285_001809 [Trifolium repens]KAK2454222.1 hypothetical protein QL285_001810 [Trifolium repens]
MRPTHQTSEAQRPTTHSVFTVTMKDNTITVIESNNKTNSLIPANNFVVQFHGSDGGRKRRNLGYWPPLEERCEPGGNKDNLDLTFFF